MGIAPKLLILCEWCRVSPDVNNFKAETSELDTTLILLFFIIFIIHIIIFQSEHAVL